MKGFKIERPCYTMASTDGVNAEIKMYGEICETRPVDWWTGEEIKGDFILQDEFLEDLKRVEGCREITLRMNSGGGDAAVSILIHNRLRELADSGADLICIVDGIAMSGGSLIMCACDTVKVNPSSLVMIHKCLGIALGYYNADELRSMATRQDAYDKAQVSIYARKTGLSDTIITHMMGDVTYMTGKEAVEKGFADELIEGEGMPLAASADGGTIYAGGRAFRLAPGMFAPDWLETKNEVSPEDGEGKAPSSEDINSKQPDKNRAASAAAGGQEDRDMTLEELRKQYPEPVAQAEREARAAGAAEGAAQAIQAERERLRGIDEIAALYDDDLVAEARYGKTACDAKELAFRGAKAAAGRGQAYAANLETQASASGANSVPAAAAPNDGQNAGVSDIEKTFAVERAKIAAVLHPDTKDSKED